MTEEELTIYWTRLQNIDTFKEALVILKELAEEVEIGKTSTVS